MPRNPDLPCSRCGQVMWRGRTSLGEGRTVCQACRRADPEPHAPRTAPTKRGTARAATRYKTPARQVQCAKCGITFATHRPNQRYCQIACRPRNHQRKDKNTTDRGYGNAHMKTRRELLPKAWGTPCPLCGVLMLRGQKLDLDHSTPLSLDSTAHGDRMTHSWCNRSRGNGTRRRRHPPITPLPAARTVSRAW
jgi:hypothetical protein